MGKYISVLVDLNLIKREISITFSWKSRKRLYFIEDNFFNFWFRFIYSHLEYIETNSIELLTIIKKEFNSYIDFVFEQISKQFLIEKRHFNFSKIGRQWEKIPKAPKGQNTYEIDLVAFNEETQEIRFYECKWKDLKLKMY